MIRPTRTLALVAGAALLLVGLVPAAPALPVPPPDCFGRKPTIVGTDAGETLMLTPSPDVVWGGGGADTIDVISPGDFQPEDRICGGEGNDLIHGFGIGERVDGGPGWDTIDYAWATGAVRVDLQFGFAFNEYNPTMQLPAGRVQDVEYANGSLYGDYIYGSPGVNYLFGMDGTDHIEGRGGFDFIDGGADNDDLDGGPGRDILTFFEADLGVIVSLEDGTVNNNTAPITGPSTRSVRRPDVSAPAGSDIVNGFEGVFGTPYDDEITGSDAVDDTFIGGFCYDPFADLYCADGDDTFDGRGGQDFVFLLFAPGQMVVDLTKGRSSGNGDDWLTSVEGILGSPFTDTLIGSPGPDFLFGSGGNDALFGEAGDDFLIGGTGTDSANGGPNRDGCLEAEAYAQCENQKLDTSQVNSVLKGFRKGFRKN